MLSERNMVSILRHRCEEAGGQATWAKEHDLNGGYVSNVLSGRQRPGPKIIKALGYKQVTTFLPLQSGSEVV